MKEDPVSFLSGNLRLEGLYLGRAGTQAALIAHPHPMMGGSMHDAVVDAVGSAFAAEGYSALKFNFRGVGGSEGIYDEGRGEESDVRSARDFLQRNGKGDITLAGYSFGAWVATNLLAKDGGFAGSILLSPPLDFMNFLDSCPKIDLMIYGRDDPYCSEKSIVPYAEKCGSQLECIRHADHFYSGKEKQLTDIIRKHLIRENPVRS